MKKNLWLAAAALLGFALVNGFSLADEQDSDGDTLTDREETALYETDPIISIPTGTNLTTGRKSTFTRPIPTRTIPTGTASSTETRF